MRPAHLSEADYASTLAREYNMVEPEDVLKWETVHPTRQSFDFSQGDQIVDFATRHNMKVRGHTGLASAKPEMADGRKIYFRRAG